MPAAFLMRGGGGVAQYLQYLWLPPFHSANQIGKLATDRTMDF